MTVLAIITGLLLIAAGPLCFWACVLIVEEASEPDLPPVNAFVCIVMYVMYSSVVFAGPFMGVNILMSVLNAGPT